MHVAFPATRRRAAVIASAAFALLGAVGALGATSAQATYCNGTYTSHNSCQWGTKQWVSYNEVDASNDAVCEALSNATPPPHPTVGILYTPEDCISSGASSAGSHYSTTLPNLYPWIGNRHTFNVAVTTATHFDIYV
jgi:hypothetical protein